MILRWARVVWDEQLRLMKETWRRRAQEDSALAEKRRGQAGVKARKAAEYLRSHYRAERVFLYGSLAWSEHFTIHSDIDLFVEGFAPEKEYWRMLGELEELTAPFPVSVILAKDAVPGLAAIVHQKGVEL